MAKNKVYIDVVVDDKGTTKRVAVNAKKLGLALEETGKSARTADRNLKGVSQQSANGAKNFSKMAQGISGGLVPAYATLAAQVFALTALFDFFRRAADVQNLEAAQVAYAQNTGTALGAMTTRLREASGGMLGFREAAQSAAIGVAKGFSASQLESLAEGARKASTALGRDFEDSFDRLVRGVSKAEPELLDELGITLRLENATKNYAAALDKQVDSLTDAERSQAVLLEVQKQLDDQFGKVEPQENAFIKLSKTFSDLARDVTGSVLPAFEFVAEILNKNAKAAALFFGLLVLSIVRTIPGMDTLTGAVGKLFSALNPLAGAVTGFKNLSSGVKKFASDTRSSVSGAVEEYKDFKRSIDQSIVSLEQLQAKGAAKARGVAQQIAPGSESKTVAKVAAGTATGRDITILKKSLKRAEAEYKKSGEIVSGVFAGEDIKRIKHLRAALNDMTQDTLRFGTRIKNIYKGIGLAGRAVWIPLKTGAKAAFSTIIISAKLAGKAVNAAMKATVILGVISTIVSAMERVANAPYTLVTSVISTIQGAARGIQGLANLTVELINGLAAKLPDWAKKLLGMEGEGAVLFTPFTFAEGLERDLLDKVGTKTLEALSNQEEQAKNQQRIKEKTEELKNSYTDLADAIKISTAAAAEGSEERINSIATLGIASGMRKAEALSKLDADAGLLAMEDFKKKVKDAGLDKISEDLYNAAVSGDLKRVEQLEGFASAYIGNIEALKDQVGNLPQIVQEGDLTALEEYLRQMDLTKVAANENAAALGEVSQATSVLSGVLSEFEGPENLRLQLKAIREEAGAIKLSDLQQDTRTSQGANAPKIITEELARQVNLQKQINALKALNNDLDRLNIQIKEAGDGDSVNVSILQQEKAELEERIQNQTALVQNATENANVFSRLGNTISETLASGFERAFQGLIMGTMSAKEAFANLAKSILADIAAMIAKQLVLNMLIAATGGSGGFFGSLLGARTGGIFEQDPSMRYGGVAEKVQAYAGGGIAKGRQAGYPAILHGTEAVVPLPNGKEIPVQMTKGSGQTNNVVVNVSVDSNGNAQQNQSSTGQQGAGLGKAIAAAVQKELQNQKRSGGILNPYGAA